MCTGGVEGKLGEGGGYETNYLTFGGGGMRRITTFVGGGVRNKK